MTGAASKKMDWFKTRLKQDHKHTHTHTHTQNQRSSFDLCIFMQLVISLEVRYKLAIH